MIVISDSDPDEPEELVSSKFDVVTEMSSDSETELRLIKNTPVHCLQ